MANAEIESILSAGAEGGTLTLVARFREGRRLFRLVRDESAFGGLEEFDREDLHGQSEWVAGWPAALRMLDSRPWWLLFPIAVHPAFRGLVRFAVLERGGEAEAERWEERIREVDERAAGHRPARRPVRPEGTEDRRGAAVSLSFDAALMLASAVHQDQKRKGTQIPYITHPVHVARILQQHGWPEDVAVAGLLHDVLEDMKPEDKAVRDRIRAVVPGLADFPDEARDARDAVVSYIARTFGPDTLRLVEAVSEAKKDADGVERPWCVRKLERLRALQHEDAQVAALKAADLLHNMVTVTRDLCAEGAGVLRRFNAGPKQTLWQFGTACAIAWDRLGIDDPLGIGLNHAFRTLERAVEEAGEVRNSRLWAAHFDTAARPEPGDSVHVLGRDGRRIYGIAQWLDVAPPREGAKQWRDGRSAKELARSWFRDPVAAVPGELRELLATGEATRGLTAATALPEWTTPLGDDAEREGRNHDLLLLGVAGERRVVVGIEAKADEEFGPTVGERVKAAAAKNAEPGRTRMSIVPERIDRICRMLFGRSPDEELSGLRYQLLHALAGTVIEAERRGADVAIFVVYEFVSAGCRPEALDRNRQDLDRFVQALAPTLGRELRVGHLVGPLRLPGGRAERPDIFIGKVTTNIDAGDDRREA